MNRLEEIAPLIGDSNEDNGDELSSDSHSSLDKEWNILVVLPAELQIKIMSHLDIVSLCRCAQVCKAWHTYALDGSCWQRVNFFDFQRDVTDDVVVGLAHRCLGFLRAVDLSGCEMVQNNAVVLLTKECWQLEELVLKGCVSITERCLSYVAQNCRKLRLLDVSEGPKIRSAGCRYIVRFRSQLECLKMAWCKEVSAQDLAQLFSTHKSLRVLSLKGCSVDNNVLVSIGANCSSLQQLDLFHCDSITNDGVIALADGCKDLRCLCLSYCCSINNLALRVLAVQCPNLRTLQVAECVHLDDQGFIFLSEHCRKLSCLDLEECVRITDATLAAFAVNCPDLSLLILSCCHQITDAGIARFASEECVAKNIQVLELDNCPNLSDACLETFTNMTSLNRVELYDCGSITRDGITRLQADRDGLEVHIYFPPPLSEVAAAIPNRRCRCPCCNCAIL